MQRKNVLRRDKRVVVFVSQTVFEKLYLKFVTESKLPD